MMPFRARFRSFLLAALLALTPAALVGLIWPLGATLTYAAVGIYLWIWLDARMP
jgi:hypothetical protein